MSDGEMYLVDEQAEAFGHRSYETASPQSEHNSIDSQSRHDDC